MSTLYLVTGAAGFIGSNLVEYLVRKGERVRGIDNFSTGRRSNIAHLLNDFEFIEGDILDGNILAKAMKGVTFVLHQAAIPSVPRSIEDPVSSNDSNIKGTLAVLIAAREAGVERFVYASSSSVYGNSPLLPKTEDMPVEPLSPYAVTKYAGEQYSKIWWNIYGLPSVSLRYFNVFGPRQNPDSEYSAVIPKFIKIIKEGKRPVIYGDGEQTRDFTHVDNVIAANLLATSVPQAVGRVFNIACGERTSINELVRLIARVTGREVEPVYEKERRGEVKHSVADISLARKLLGYSVTVDIKTGLERTVDHYS